MAPPSVLLFGSTGNVGALITTALAQRKAELGKIAFYARPFSNPEKEALYKAVEAQGLERVEGDIRDLAVYRGIWTPPSLRDIYPGAYI